MRKIDTLTANCFPTLRKAQVYECLPYYEDHKEVDLLAARRGLQDADSYLAQWKWSEEEDREGSADEVAAAVKAELEAKADW